MTPPETLIDGPCFEDLRHGQRFDDSPGLTLTEGLAAAHRAIVGGRMPLTLDRELSRQVIGEGGMLAAPNLVWDVAIGQSTIVTHTVVANLFYRGVVFRRAPRIGDTLRTVTEVVGLRQNSRRAGRRATGLAALRISTRDQETVGAAGRLVYGGHTIGTALHQAVRALTGIVTVVGWHSCDHVGPVREGDTLTSAIEVERTDRSVRGGTLAHLRSRVRASRSDTPGADVLDWRFVALLA
jgi:acyl dehydratase